jgi:hypothetical protein
MPVDSNKLSKMLSIISEKLMEKKISCCVIGAMALGLFGLPRYTSDLDLLASESDWKQINSVMKRLGYTCYQKTDSFAQFDSELGVFGKVDFMLVNGADGRAMIRNSCLVDDALLGKLQVIQPTDYIILKLMAIANNPDRALQDESDISGLVNLMNAKLLSDVFLPLNREKIYEFADRFGQRPVVQKYLTTKKKSDSGNHRI